jgi:hypothetical protein
MNALGMAIVDEIASDRQIAPLSLPIFFRATYQIEYFSDNKPKERAWFIHRPYLPPAFPVEKWPGSQNLMPPQFAPPPNARFVPVEAARQVVASLTGTSEVAMEGLGQAYLDALNTSVEKYNNLYQTFATNKPLNTLFTSCIRSQLERG